MSDFSYRQITYPVTLTRPGLRADLRVTAWHQPAELMNLDYPGCSESWEVEKVVSCSYAEATWPGGHYHLTPAELASLVERLKLTEEEHEDLECQIAEYCHS